MNTTNITTDLTDNAWRPFRIRRNLFGTQPGSVCSHLVTKQKFRCIHKNTRIFRISHTMRGLIKHNHKMVGCMYPGRALPCSVVPFTKAQLLTLQGLWLCGISINNSLCAREKKTRNLPEEKQGLNVVSIQRPVRAHITWAVAAKTQR